MCVFCVLCVVSASASVCEVRLPRLMLTEVSRMRGIISILIDFINVDQTEHTFVIAVHS